MAKFRQIWSHWMARANLHLLLLIDHVTIGRSLNFDFRRSQFREKAIDILFRNRLPFALDRMLLEAKVFESKFFVFQIDESIVVKFCFSKLPQNVDHFSQKKKVSCSVLSLVHKKTQFRQYQNLFDNISDSIPIYSSMLNDNV